MYIWETVVYIACVSNENCNVLLMCIHSTGWFSLKIIDARIFIILSKKKNFIRSLRLDAKEKQTNDREQKKTQTNYTLIYFCFMMTTQLIKL